MATILRHISYCHLYILEGSLKLLFSSYSLHLNMANGLLADGHVEEGRRPERPHRLQHSELGV